MKASILFILTLTFGLFGSVGTTALQVATSQDRALELRSQTPWVPADGEMQLGLAWNRDITETTTIQATIWAPILDEVDVYAEPAVVVNRTAAVPLQSLSRDEAGNLSFSIAVRSFQSRGSESIYLGDPGVYPVTIEVRDEAGTIARVRTNLIHLPTDIANIPLFPISMVLSISSADGLELSEAIQLLEAHPSLPMTVLLEDGLLPQLQSDPELTSSFVAALGDRTVVAGIQLDLDPSALASIGQPDYYRRALSSTRERFAEVGVDLDPSIIPMNAGVTPDGAELLTSSGIEIVIDLQTAAGSSGSMASNNGSLTVVRIDNKHTSELIDGRASPRTTNAVQRAHRLLALLAVRYQTDRSPIILGGTGLRNADLQALEVVLDSLDQGGMMEAISMKEAASGSRTLPFRPQENPDQNLGDIREELLNVDKLLATYTTFRVTGGPSVEGIQVRLAEGLSRDLNPTARATAIRTISEDLAESFNVISLPEGPAITLAAQTSAIPLTITNTSSGIRRVQLRFQSDRIGVVEQNQEFLVPPGESQIPIHVEARSLGVSSLLVTVLTPDGTRQLATTRFEIRSTAIPGLGYALSGTALLFLIVWWLRSISQTRALHKHSADGESTEVASEDDKADTTLSG